MKAIDNLVDTVKPANAIQLVVNGKEDLNGVSAQIDFEIKAKMRVI